MIRKKEYALYLALYITAFIFIITTQGVFWDDWVVFHVNPASRLELYTMSGRPFYGHFFNFLFSLDYDGSVIFRILIFSCFLFPIFIVDKLLSSIREITSTSRMFLVVLFLLFPVNSSRIAITMAQYSFCNFLFFAAFWLTGFYIEKPKIVLRLLSLLLFYFSFTMDSLQMFFAVVIIYLFYLEYDRERALSYVLIKKFVLKYLDYLALPFVYLFIKQTFFKPYGLYENYNKISLAKLLEVVHHIYPHLKEVIKPIMLECKIVATQHRPVVFLMSLIVYIILCVFFKNKEKAPVRPIQKLFFFILGIVFLILAIFPYFVVGSVPLPYYWASRHQVLMPLGGAFTVYFGSEVVFGLIDWVYGKIKGSELKYYEYIKNIYYSVLIAVFVLSNFIFLLQYQKDWFKQLSISENMRVNKTIRDHTSFHFVDKTMDRVFNSYEITGLMKYTFGNETRYASADKKFNDKIGDLVPYAQYNMLKFIPKSYEFTVSIDNGSFLLDNRGALKIVFYRMFNTQKFKSAIKNIVVLSVEPYL